MTEAVPGAQADTPSGNEEVERAALASMMGFREAALERASRHVDGLLGNYREAAEQFRKKLSDEQQEIAGDLERFRKEALKELDDRIKALRSDSGQVANEASRIKVDLQQASKTLKDALEEWEQKHKGTFQALDRFQKEYRETIEKFDTATARMDKIVHGSRNLSAVSVISVFVASALGTALVHLLLLHAG